MLCIVSIIASLPLGASAQWQVEYFFDSDPGQGNATKVSATVNSNGDVDFSVPTTNLVPGFHLMGVRAAHAGNYGPTVLQNIYVPTNTADNVITHVEYFWDSDPGIGHATPISITPGNSVNLQDMPVPATGLSAGQHQIGVRAYGPGGWGSTQMLDVYIPADAGYYEVSEAEYFWDNDPGYGNGTPVSISSGQAVSIDGLGISVSSLPIGEHQLFVRYRGTNGWSPTICSDVYVTGGECTIASAEYFWNEDPGFGKGSPINIAPGEKVTLEALGIPSTTVHGNATLFIRYRGVNGWSPTVSQFVMVDVEGHYTLNASAATSMEARNYQSLTDALSDFADRGIGNSVELEVKTTDATYELDATADGMLQQVQQIAQNLESLSTNSDTKIITFTAAAGSGNTVSISATNLADVMPLLSRIATQNVTLLVNGTEMDFSALTERQQTVCTGTPTEAVNLSTIGGGITAQWTAQPHTGTVLSGFAAEAVTDLPSMTVTNSGIVTDSVTYAVTLNKDGQQLYAYTYYIYTRASMSRQAFTAMTPATGTSLNPGSLTLTWDALQNVESYSLTVTDVTDADAPVIVLDGYSVDAMQSEYTLTAEAGHQYTWQVTAYGPCDELQSPLMNFSVRLLSDLTVTAITLPEAAQGGNTLTVRATILNQGLGATTEQPWIDRLYYVLDGTDFSQAVEAADVERTANIAAGESYEAVFSMRVPAVENGMMRVFVVADAEGKVLETDDTNNRLMSTNAATLSPFYMNTTDLAALRQLCTDLGGDSWNGTKWTPASELITDQNWSGVTFDADGRVTAINLQGRNLTGSLSVATPYVATMSQLKSLNLSRNAITGDPALFLANAAANLTSVDLSYNRIYELSAPLSPAITSLSLGYQNRLYNNYKTFPGFDSADPVDLSITGRMTPQLPSLLYYSHAAQAFTNHPDIKVWQHRVGGLQNLYGTLKWSATNECYTFSQSHSVMSCEQDELVHLRIEGGAMAESSYPATIHFVKGDANSTGFIDVNDVQTTLNYIINSGSYKICLWAANTWDSDDIINIQDIVSTVNIVLDNQGESAAARPATVDDGFPVANSPAAGSPAALFHTRGRYLLLDATEPVASFDVELRGVSEDQVRLLLPHSDWQMQTRNTAGGVRLVVFSPTGASLPALSGQQLLRLSTTAEPLRADASSPDAEPVTVAVGGTATGITEIESDEENAPVYDLLGRRLDDDAHLQKGIYILNGKKVKR